MAKLKTVAAKAVLQVHKHEHKTRTTLEAISALFVAVETHLPVFAVLLVIWAIYDVLDLFEVKL